MHIYIKIMYIFTYVFVHILPPPVQVSTFMYIYICIYVRLLHTDFISPASTKIPKVGRAHHGDSVPTY